MGIRIPKCHYKLVPRCHLRIQVTGVVPSPWSELANHVPLGSFHGTGSLCWCHSLGQAARWFIVLSLAHAHS